VRGRTSRGSDLWNVNGSVPNLRLGDEREEEGRKSFPLAFQLSPGGRGLIENTKGTTRGKKKKTSLPSLKNLENSGPGGLTGRGSNFQHTWGLERSTVISEEKKEVEIRQKASGRNTGEKILEMKGGGRDKIKAAQHPSGGELKRVAKFLSRERGVRS